MGLNLSIFRSRLARRFFVMFILCALIPIFALTCVSYLRVVDQLKQQAGERLHQLAKAHAFTIYEHLSSALQCLHLIQAWQGQGSDISLAELPPGMQERAAELFEGLALVRSDKSYASWGRALPVDPSQPIESMQLAGETVRLASWRTEPGQSAGQAAVTLALRQNGPGQEERFLIGLLNRDHLWGVETGNVLPEYVEVVIWDDQGRPLFTSLPAEADSRGLDWRGGEAGHPINGQTQVSIRQQRYWSAYWSVFLKPQFAISQWTVMVLEPQEIVLEPLQVFHTIFRLVLVLVVLMVLVLSIWAIHWSLTPIQALMTGARRVAARQFSHRVVVHSKDEFNDLAEAFNCMSQDLDDQFKNLIARADMDRAILSVCDIDQITSNAIEHARRLYAFERAAVSILGADVGETGRSFVYTGASSADKLQVLPFHFGAPEHAELEKHRDWIRFESADALPCLTMLAPEPDHCFYVFPIRLNGRLFSLFSMAFTCDKTFQPAELQWIREFCNHLAVAFANANLVQELKALNLGTLYALARTVDANSAWTAGHSVRVTRIALILAEALGLPPSEQEQLHRAGLLHDIGKIGIPARLLNKEGPLSREEYSIIQHHPTIGARILSPIKAYASLIPIVEQHHERYDGKGYPLGLIREQIHLSARILALADAFDAMVSDRPYRKGLSLPGALRIIQSEAGLQFDPRLVAEFVKIVPVLRDAVTDPMEEKPTGDDHLPIGQTARLAFPIPLAN